MYDSLPMSAVLDLPLTYPVADCMDVVQCRNTGYCEPSTYGLFEDLNAQSYSAP